MLTARLTIERAPTGWSIQAHSCVDDDGPSTDAVIDHAWWFGIGAGTQGVRWEASSAAASEHGYTFTES